MKWTKRMRKGRDRYVFQTRRHTAAVRQRGADWLWTVHRRGGVQGGPRLEAHGKCKTQAAAMSEAQNVVLCECYETASRNCPVHQNEEGHRESVRGENHGTDSRPGDKCVSGEQPCCVYFVGSDSTGKTELSRYVARAYGMRRVPESARAMLDEEGLSLADLRATAADADAYQRLVFDRQLRAEAQTQWPYVADRGLDNLAYASDHGRCFRELFARPEVAAYVERQRKDVVFLVRPQKELRSEDGVRKLPSWEGQQRIDAKIELLLQLWGIVPVVIAESSAARREEMIDWCLQSRGFVKRNG